MEMTPWKLEEIHFGIQQKRGDMDTSCEKSQDISRYLIDISNEIRPGPMYVYMYMVTQRPRTYLSSILPANNLQLI